jgi:hypothetical protein
MALQILSRGFGSVVERLAVDNSQLAATALKNSQTLLRIEPWTRGDHSPDQISGDDSPSPAGEGRGEGGSFELRGSNGSADLLQLMNRLAVTTHFLCIGG